MEIEKRIKIAGLIAGISAIVFAIPHFWFWFGISLAFPGDFGTMLHSDILWIVGGLAILAATYALVFTHSSFVRRLPELIVALPAWIGAVGFTLWGLAYFNSQIQLALGWVQSTSQFAAANTNPNAIWGYYWYSLFILWGLSLGVAAFCYHKLEKSRA